MSIITIKNLDVVFGSNPKAAFKMLDEGCTRKTIKEKTGAVVGVMNANLQVQKGEIFVLMGLSGSGKSTLLRTINGLNPISRGTIELELEDDGHIRPYSLKEMDGVTLRHLRSKHISMVFQRFALLPWKTVLENVGFGLEISHIKKAARIERAMQCIKMVGLESWASQYPSELSGGMQQRVGLARALATNADILLMDEPFSALDPLIKTHLQKELLNLQKTLKKTILFVTHDLDEALKLGSRIAIMQEGKIDQIGTAEEIITHPKTSYVKDFVANIDHTKLLKANSIMTALSDLKKDAQSRKICLDEFGHYQCQVDEGGRPKKASCNDREGRVVPWSLFQSGSFGDNDIICANEHLHFKDIIDVLGRTRRPLVVQDHTGKMVGAVTSASIVSALAAR